MAEWQPIETAPQDRPFILYSRTHRIQEARLAHNGWGWNVRTGFVRKDNGLMWMPLPDPPKDSTR